MHANLERGFRARRQTGITKWICVYILIWLIAFSFISAFFIDNLQILLPTFVTIALFLYFSLRLRSQIQDNIFGEIGFLYLAFAVAYTVYPACGFLALNSLSSWAFQSLGLLSPDPAQIGLQLWRHVLFIAAVGSGYLLFRGRHTPKLFSSVIFGDAQKLIVLSLFVATFIGVVVPWSLSAPVETYVDNYTRYDNLPWIGTRIISICNVLKTGGTFVLLSVLFRNYKRYRLFIWLFVILRVLQEVLGSFGARIGAFTILITAALLYHYCVEQITLKKGLLLMLALGSVFSAIEIARATDLNPTELKDAAMQNEGMPAGELGAVFLPGFHLYAERANGTLPPVPLQLFFNDFISMLPLAQTKWSPMYWYAENYFPNAPVPPMTMGPIALSALWGGEISLALQGMINGISFALLMRWFARNSAKWQIMTVYVFCYSTCIMCLKYSIFWHLESLVKVILPLVLLISIFAWPWRLHLRRNLPCPPESGIVSAL
jgi:hypothetical protein